MRVACVGEAMIELSPEGLDTARLGVAGDTLNTAVYLKRSAPGIAVDYITRLGDDPFSQRITDFIASEGIGTGRIAHATGETPGLYAISTDAHGERTFTYWRDRSAARGLFGDRDLSALEGYDLVYLSGITLAILPLSVRRALLDGFRRGAGRLAFDSNYRPRLWESAEVARKTCRDFWEVADIALPSIDDEAALFGETQKQVETRWARSLAQGALKRGALGPVSIGTEVHQCYPAAVHVVDTTAAGDSFNGAYLAAILGGAGQAEALRAGHDLAVRVVGQRGAIVTV